MRNADKLERIKALRLIDDEFMTLCFDGYVEGAQLLLDIILGHKELKVTEVKTQKVLKNINGRDVWLDIYATDAQGNKYNIEIQRCDKGAISKRARYHSSMIDADMLGSGCEFTELHDSYVIFITENDVMGKNEPAYHVDRYVREIGIPFNDGAHIIYVNGALRSEDTELGRLMSDMFCSDVRDIHYKELAERVKFFKETEKGVSSVSGVFDEIREETRIENALAMLADGMPLENVAKYTGLSLDKVQELAGEKTA